MDLVRRPGTPRIGDRFLIDGGDGDQSFFGTPQKLILTQAGWFTGDIQDFYGKALLFVVDGGKYDGKYIALTPRVVGSLEEHFQGDGYSSVIVWFVENPTSTFSGSTTDARAIGMAPVYRTEESK